MIDFGRVRLHSLDVSDLATIALPLLSPNRLQLAAQPLHELVILVIVNVLVHVEHSALHLTPHTLSHLRLQQLHRQRPTLS